MVADVWQRMTPTNVVLWVVVVIFLCSIIFASIGGKFYHKVVLWLGRVWELLGSSAKVISAIVPVIGACYAVRTAIVEGNAKIGGIYDGQSAGNSLKEKISKKLGNSALENSGDDDGLAQTRAALLNLEQEVKELKSQGFFWLFYRTAIRRSELSSKIFKVKLNETLLPTLVAERVANAAVAEVHERLHESFLDAVKKKASVQGTGSNTQIDKLNEAITQAAHEATKASVEALEPAQRKAMAHKTAMTAVNAALPKLQKKFGDAVHVTANLPNASFAPAVNAALPPLMVAISQYAQSAAHPVTAPQPGVTAPQPGVTAPQPVIESLTNTDELRILQSEIEKLMRSTWYNNNEKNKKDLEEKEKELTEKIQGMPPNQRLEWLKLVG